MLLKNNYLNLKFDQLKKNKQKNKQTKNQPKNSISASDLGAILRESGGPLLNCLLSETILSLLNYLTKWLQYTDKVKNYIKYWFE